MLKLQRSDLITIKTKGLGNSWPLANSWSIRLCRGVLMPSKQIKHIWKSMLSRIQNWREAIKIMECRDPAQPEGWLERFQALTFTNKSSSQIMLLNLEWKRDFKIKRWLSTTLNGNRQVPFQQNLKEHLWLRKLQALSSTCDLKETQLWWTLNKTTKASHL